MTADHEGRHTDHPDRDRAHGRTPEPSRKAPGHAGHSVAGHEMAPQRPSGLVQAKLDHLQEMRALQSLLERERRREFEEQRQHDAEAQRLMDADPRGHIEMMRSMQERQTLVRELPEALLEREADLLGEIEQAGETQPDAKAKELGMGVLMAQHVLMEHWAHIAVLPLGAWLVASPSAFGYGGGLAWSDIISGLLVIAFGALSVGRRPWAPWANGVVGLWLMFAPLAFWTPEAVAYANDTLVGMLIIAFAVIIPRRTEMPGPDIPPGWTYSPSTWLQRGPIIALAVVSFLMARYMAAFQLGHIPSAWDPLFGKGTELVLTSDVSRAFPISDAGLGAYTYLIEILSGLMGDSRRWRTMPWMVAMFGFAVIPLGVTSVILIMLQPVAVGAWCTLCLASALLMLLMVTLSLDEIVATVQFLIIGRRAGLSAWRLFWIGGELPRPLAEIGMERRPGNRWMEMIGGANAPWPLLASALLGTWLFASPAVFGMSGAAADTVTVLGALVVVVAFIAFAEVGRAARFLNIPLALAMAGALWVLPGASLAARFNGLVAGALLIALSIPRGPIRNRYGGWDPFIV